MRAVLKLIAKDNSGGPLHLDNQMRSANPETILIKKTKYPPKQPPSNHLSSHQTLLLSNAMQ